MWLICVSHTWMKQVKPSSDCMILAQFLARRQVLRNRRQMPEIIGKSVLVHASDNHAVWMSKDGIWENRRRVADACEIFGMLNIWTCRRFKILLCEKCSDWKLHRRWPTANERARYRAAGSSGRSYRPQYQQAWLLFFFLFSLQNSAQAIRKASFLRATIFNNNPSLTWELRSCTCDIALFPCHISCVFGCET